MIGKVASPGQKGEKASPAGIYVVEAATIISPGQGEEKKMSVAAAASDSSKPPSFTTGTLPVEGRSPSRLGLTPQLAQQVALRMFLRGKSALFKERNLWPWGTSWISPWMTYIIW